MLCYITKRVITYVMLLCYITCVMLCYITCVMLCGPPCSRARNTDAFQVVVYEAEFFSQCVMGRFLFLTRVTNEGISFRV